MPIFFAALAPHSGLALPSALATVAGVFIGSSLWGIGGTTVLSLMRRATGPRVLWIDRIAGIALMLFGALELRKVTR